MSVFKNCLTAALLFIISISPLLAQPEVDIEFIVYL
jgi:hypothetical protein